MKKMLLVAGLLFCSVAAFATESPQYDDSKLLAQNYNQERVVTAYYVNGGQLVRIKIKVSGSFVTAYSTGKDYVGQEQWHSLPNCSIRKTNSSFDGSELAREFDYTATLSISNGYQTSSLKVYF